MPDYKPTPTRLTRLTISENTPTGDPIFNTQATSLFISDMGTVTPTPASCVVEIQSTTGGFVFPRMTTAQRLALSETNGMYVYDTTLNSFYAVVNNAWVAK